MFGLIRLVILCAVAFVAGVFFERNNFRSECAKVGDWQQGFCYNAEIPND